MTDCATIPAGALLAALDHYAAGRTGAAAGMCRALLRDDPEQPHALTLLGQCLLRTGEAADAARLLARAAAARPDHAETAVSLGRARLLTGDVAGALTAWRAVLERTPDHAGARLAVAETLLAGGDPRGALGHADVALAYHPALAEALFLRGTALGALGEHGAAVAALREAVLRRPGHAQALLNLGNALDACDEPAAGLACIRAAIEADPTLAEAHASIAHVLMERGSLAEAIAHCDAAIRLRPGLARAHWNRGIACLLAGDWAAGWEGYEWRRRDPALRLRMPHLPGPVWDGAAGARTVMIAAEQGLGDTIQCARYAPMMAARGVRVALACDARLVGLMRRVAGIACVVDRTGPLPGYDAWVDQMSLPGLFGTRPDSVPRPARFGAMWAARGGRVGIVWAGNPGHSNDRRRSLPVAALARFGGAGADWISLQVGPRSGEAAVLGAADRSGALPDMAATADVIAGLDLVVTIDSAVAHLAASLDCPTWVMLAHAPDWRWMLGPETTPWYPAMRLFRQAAPGDWDGVIARVLAALRDAKIAGF